MVDVLFIFYLLTMYLYGIRKMDIFLARTEKSYVEKRSDTPLTRLPGIIEKKTGKKARNVLPGRLSNFLRRCLDRTVIRSLGISYDFNKLECLTTIEILRVRNSSEIVQAI